MGAGCDAASQRDPATSCEDTVEEGPSEKKARGAALVPLAGRGQNARSPGAAAETSRERPQTPCR
jgi:hypothetical protein